VTDLSPIWHAITGAALVLVGALIGAWLTHRASSYQSPIPSLRRPAEAEGGENGKPQEPPKARL
jgi:hypothetical protein